MTLPTVGERLVTILEGHGVEVVFGIPGVHTVELYRGLAASRIRHVTPRHEQGAGFMADGYARVSGRPGVCFLISGPGLTNAITAVAQARADSVPLLVISSVGTRAGLAHDRGSLHELPDQRGLLRQLVRYSHTLLDPGDLDDVLARAFATLASGRPGPVHVEIPLDVLGEPVPAPLPVAPPRRISPPRACAGVLAELAALCRDAARPVILAGGGARRADGALRQLAEALDAPVVTTVNGRGLLAGHPLCVPASPSLPAVRALLAGADLVLAPGTEMGSTDYDMYVTGDFPALPGLVRVDVDADQLARGPQARLSVLAEAGGLMADLLSLVTPRTAGGAARAARARSAALAGLGPDYRQMIALIGDMATALPGVLMVGDSTQPVYAGNLYADIALPGGWFNSATGYGALGYGAPAAIGAALAAPERPVIAITGDGGLQFSLAELGSAMDEGARVIFLVWNNNGYREIETHMRKAGITPVGVRPSAPDFTAVARAYGMRAERVAGVEGVIPALARAAAKDGPCLIEVMVP
ncbi:MAG: 5-guanidino-2-oxopentanoate decarboxylase [Rubellimicrobium sp.]|nr:5-guanidino-2-oxopentanoate decarboxylase [Rubellimicrobium sp.]